MLDTRALSRPHNLVDAQDRVLRNIEELQGNYAIGAASATAFVLVLHPGSLAVLAALAVGWAAMLSRGDAPLSIQGRVVSKTEQMYAGVALSLAVVLLFTNVAALLLSALALAAAVVATHAALRMPDAGAAGAAEDAAERGGSADAPAPGGMRRSGSASGSFA